MSAHTHDWQPHTSPEWSTHHACSICGLAAPTAELVRSGVLAPQCCRSLSMGGIELERGVIADRWRRIGGTSCYEAVMANGEVVTGAIQYEGNVRLNVGCGTLAPCEDAPVQELSAFRLRRAERWLEESDKALGHAVGTLLLGSPANADDLRLHAELLEARARVLKLMKQCRFGAEDRSERNARKAVG